MSSSSEPKQLGELVTEGPVAFWTPPPIAYGPRPQEAGKRKLGRKSKSLWHRFIEVDSMKEPSLCLFVKEGQTAMVLKSQVSEEGAAFESEVETPDREPGRCTFWDRHKQRRLTFIRPINYTKQVYYDYSTFGFPLPEMTFVMGTSKQGFLPVNSSSSWAYTQPHPMSEDQVGSKPSFEECRPKHLLPAPQTYPLTSIDDSVHKQDSQHHQFLELPDDHYVEEAELMDWDELELLVEQKGDPLPPSVPYEQALSSSGPHQSLLEQVLPQPSPYPLGAGQQADVSSGKMSKMKARRKRGTAKKTCTGHRQALFERFGINFWELLDVMTPTEFASCTPEQQRYITERRAIDASRQGVDGGTSNT